MNGRVELLSEALRPANVAGGYDAVSSDVSSDRSDNMRSKAETCPVAKSHIIPTEAENIEAASAALDVSHTSNRSPANCERFMWLLSKVSGFKAPQMADAPLS